MTFIIPSPREDSSGRGDCYRQSCQFLLKNDLTDGIIVHGRIWAGNPSRWISHSWAEFDDQVYCPHIGIMSKEDYYFLVTPKVDREYAMEESLCNFAKSKGSWGPWE